MAPSLAPKHDEGRTLRAWPLVAILFAAGLLLAWAALEHARARRPVEAGQASASTVELASLPVQVTDVAAAGLWAATQLKGVVQDIDGGPAEGVLVVCEGCRGEEGPDDAGRLAVRTDAEGRFLLPVTVAQGQRFRLVAQGHGAQGWAEAGRAGEDALVRLAPPTEVRGRVTGHGGKPVHGAVVVFSEPLLSPVQLATGMDGRFSGHILPGLYQVTVVPDSSVPRRTWTVQVPQDRPVELSTGSP